MASNDQYKLRSNVGVLPSLVLVECYGSSGQADACHNIPADTNRSEVAPAAFGPEQSATRSSHHRQIKASARREQIHFKH
jgi:hypothetical protein